MATAEYSRLSDSWYRPYITPLCASYGLSFAIIWEDSGRVLATLRSDISYALTSNMYP